MADWSADELRPHPRPGRRAEGRAGASQGVADPSWPDRRADLPQAVDAHEDQLRGRDRRARRNGALRAGGGPAALARRVDTRHGARALALPERDPDPHIRPGRGRRVRGARDDPHRQRPHRRLPPTAGAGRRDDDPGAFRHARGRAGRLPRRREQRLPFTDADRGPHGHEPRRRVPRRLPSPTPRSWHRVATTPRRAAAASTS